ncbi:MAG: iron hydrogenase small subunit [Bacteroidetes bacterium]|nr:iron hydrogenase small subunit [Bacteroidota bacterium]
MITLTINGEKVTVPKGTKIIDAAKKININIPHLCHFEGLEPIGVCRLCVVEVKGSKKLMPSCMHEVKEGMEIQTNTHKLRETRKMLLELILSKHPADCHTCERNQNCELLKLANEFGVKTSTFNHDDTIQEIDDSSLSVVRDPNKCILCGRCIRVCKDIQGVGAIDLAFRGYDTVVTTFMNRGLGDSPCVNCGQCIAVCPVGALREQNSIKDVWAAIDNPKKHVVVQEAPAIRTALGEEFGIPAGTLVAGKMYAALKKIGFDKIFDTNFSADLTIIEEGNELVNRITGKIDMPLPQITSCCPAWIKYMEEFYPDTMENVSTCKSPQQMFGALVKTYYAEASGVDPKDIVSVSIMPCTAKKYECKRPEMNDSGYTDVDYVLTTRELARMIREADIDFASLPKDVPADSLMGTYSGAGTLFGATGGVMEAALRSAYKIITDKEMENIDILPVRGLKGIKTATVKINDMDVKVAVAHGLDNAKVLLDEIREGKSPYHFIEIMACPGGCVGGGGQPFGTNNFLRETRSNVLYKEDKDLPIRKSHENPAIKKVYENYLGDPLGKKSHKLLHTKYKKR